MVNVTYAWIVLLLLKDFAITAERCVIAVILVTKTVKT